MENRLPVTLLLPFGQEPIQVRSAVVREAAAFEALLPKLEPRWLMPLRAGAWSPAEVVDHVIKANSAFSKAIYFLRRDAPLPDLPKTPGVYKDGKPQASTMLLPGAPQPLDTLLPHWRSTHERLLQEMDATTAWHGRTFFHPFFGELDALGWARVAAYHLQHHRQQLSG